MVKSNNAEKADRALLDRCRERYREQYGLRYNTPARSMGIVPDDHVKVGPTPITPSLFTPLPSSPIMISSSLLLSLISEINMLSII